MLSYGAVSPAGNPLSTLSIGDLPPLLPCDAHVFASIAAALRLGSGSAVIQQLEHGWMLLGRMRRRAYESTTRSRHLVFNMSVQKSNGMRAAVRYEVNASSSSISASSRSRSAAPRSSCWTCSIPSELAATSGTRSRSRCRDSFNSVDEIVLKLAEHATMRVVRDLRILTSPGKTASVSMNNQGAFDAALLHLLNQGHRSVNSSGRSQLRALRGGKNAIGALIPDQLYSKTMEGKTVEQLLTANGAEFEPVRALLSGVALPLLNELQDLHDRTGECLPSMFRDIVREGGQRIARMFGLSPRLIQLWGAYRKLSGPRLQLKTSPVVLGGAGSGTSRYATDVAAIAVA